MIGPIFQMRKQSLPEVKGLAQGGMASHLGLSQCGPQKCLGPPWYTGSLHKGKLKPSGHGPGHPVGWLALFRRVGAHISRADLVHLSSWQLCLQRRI